MEWVTAAAPATAQAFQIALQPENALRIARELEQAIALSVEQTVVLEPGPLEAVEIALAIAAFQAAPGPAIEAALGAVLVALMGPAHAQAAAGALPAWEAEARAVVLEEEAAVAAADLVAEAVVAAAAVVAEAAAEVAGGSQS